jgi:hypothetical protein
MSHAAAGSGTADTSTFKPPEVAFIGAPVSSSALDSKAPVTV